jgi:hypothetical protein
VIAQPFHGPRREGLVDQHAQPGVVGRIGEQQHASGCLFHEVHAPGIGRLHRLFPEFGQRRRLPRIYGEPVVAQDGQDVVVPGERPQAGIRAVHRSCLAIAPVDGVRIGAMRLNDLGHDRRDRRVHLDLFAGRDIPPVLTLLKSMDDACIRCNERGAR